LFLRVLRKPFKGMAGTTGLEPATSAVTGQRSNQLNYVPNGPAADLWETRYSPKSKALTERRTPAHLSLRRN
jgi:hypothetical protein